MTLKKRCNKSMRKIVGIILILAIFAGIGFPVKKAYADEFITVDYQDKLTLSVPGGPDYWVVMSKKQLEGKEITKVVSSNKKISAYFSEEDGSNGFSLYTEKPGKATITITLSKNGKTTKKKMEITFVKYENPILKSSFVTASMVRELNQYPITRKDTKKKSEKVKIKVKNGWQILSMKYEYSPAINVTKTVNVKNGAKLKLQTYGKLHIQLKNRKKNYVERVMIRVSL